MQTKIASEKIKMKFYVDYPLAKLTTFKVGGNADFFCKPRTYEEVIESFDFAKKNNIDYYILGGGANLLISEKGIRGLVISTSKLNSFTFINEKEVRVGCGLKIDKLNKKLIKLGLSGLEFSSGLPGSVGGAVFMNARCYGKEFADVIKGVDAINENFEKETLTLDDINYSYKNSLFMKRKKIFIFEIVLKVEKSEKKFVKKEAKKNYKDRKNKGQYKYPSAGCIFKNDYNIGIPTGKIIEDLGLKGYAIGKAEVYDKHANFIVNKKNASPEDILNLIKFIEKKALDEKGYKLERELRVLGFDN
ncbi:MAG TPA: UDP-N-acetylmuramate dehydrogenase [Spirochaetota bacterium]|nr:UDP-N-acetylmuramate dehydrogenase [Spirochaetota bacterium]